MDRRKHAWMVFCLSGLKRGSSFESDHSQVFPIPFTPTLAADVSSARDQMMSGSQGACLERILPNRVEESKKFRKCSFPRISYSTHPSIRREHAKCEALCHEWIAGSMLGTYLVRYVSNEACNSMRHGNDESCQPIVPSMANGLPNELFATLQLVTG